MQNYLGIVVYLAIAIYFIFVFKKNFDKKKSLYAQGDHTEFTHFLPSFYIYTVCAIILLIYVIYGYKSLNIAEIIMGILFIIAIFLSGTLSSKVILGNNGILIMSFYLEYKHMDSIGIQKINENKFAIGFIRNNKIVFSLKLNKKNKDVLKAFITKRKVFIQEY